MQAGKPTKRNRKPSKKKVEKKIWSGDDWLVVSGRLVPGPGRPDKTGLLFRFIGEKLPYSCLRDVAKHVRSVSKDVEGVYLAHDSMGVARYGGRGDIFHRLAAHQKNYPKELLYFSFFIIKSKAHEREMETALLRAAGSQMILNERKVRTRLDVGNITDYEPGTNFVERQFVRGRKKKPGRGGKKTPA
jgi:hypothetical protein